MILWRPSCFWFAPPFFWKQLAKLLTGEDSLIYRSNFLRNLFFIVWIMDKAFQSLLKAAVCHYTFPLRNYLLFLVIRLSSNPHCVFI
ncbi:hypothetical protein 1013_scaffold3125_00032 [Bacteriophage sp.]|nr:hypothetical protein 1013_scaffold3125_00032 [Bacteriophage sp.]